MRVHHLNCVSSCPLGGVLMDGNTKSVFRGKLACHCLLVETPRELVLIDTGYGLLDVAHPRTRLSKFFLALLRPELRAEMTAIRQIERLGFRGRDVRHIVLTHLDFDHAGGLDDFPQADVHLLADEMKSAEAQSTALDRMRYRPAQWSSRSRWRTYPSGLGESWFHFDCVRDLRGVPPEILMVPLVGHTFGHAGVAVHTEKRGWLMLAGDAYFYHAEMDVKPSCPPGLRAYQKMMEKDRRWRLRNQAQLRALKLHHGHEVTLACSHDVTEFEAMAGHKLDEPARIRSPQLTLPPQLEHV